MENEMEWMKKEFGEYVELEKQSTREYLAYRRGRADGKQWAARQIEIYAAKIKTWAENLSVFAVSSFYQRTNRDNLGGLKNKLLWEIHKEN